MHPIRKIENPQHRHVGGCRVLVPPDHSIKSTPSQLRFAFWHCVAIHRVIFHYIECLGDQAVRQGQVIGRDEIEIVSRRVVLGNLSELAALEEPHRQVEPRRAILALIVAVWRKIKNRRRQPGVTNGVDNRPIYRGTATSAFLVGWAAAVSDHGNDQPMLDALAVLLIAREPCNRTDRTWCKQESVTVSR